MATTPRNYRELHGSERKPTPGARVLGPADENEKLSVTIVLNRRADGPPIPGPSYFLRTPPSERPRLSESEFAARYGADPIAIDKVSAFARAQGLTVEETNAARRTVVVSGTVAQFNRAFEIKLQIYEHEVERGPTPGKRTERYRGCDGFIRVPAELADFIVGVFGLDNRRITKRGLADPPATTLLTMPTINNSMTSRRIWPRDKQSRCSPRPVIWRAISPPISAAAPLRWSTFQWMRRTAVP